VIQLNDKRFKIKGYTVSAKVHDKPSRFGLGKGRVSKLRVKTPGGKTVINYDRGWDIKPTKDIHREILGRIVTKYRKKKKK